MSSRRGFISTRTLIALIITIILLPLACDIVSYSLSINFNYDLISNELSLYQLRKILLIAYDPYVNEDSIAFKYHGEDYTLQANNGRLILSPGYQMFLNDVEDLCFYETDDAVYVYYKIKEKEYETPIMSKEGLYIDEFLSDDELTDEYFNIDE